MSLSDLWEFTVNAFGVITLVGGFILGLVELYRVTRSQWRDPKRGPAFVLRTYGMIGLYIIGTALGILTVIEITGGEPCPDSVALPATGFVLFWIGFGVLWLIRLVPRVEPLPAWISPSFGILDAVLLALIVTCLYFAWRDRGLCGPAAQQSSIEVRFLVSGVTLQLYDGRDITMSRRNTS